MTAPADGRQQGGGPGARRHAPVLTVIGLGSRLRRDDAIGLELVASLGDEPGVHRRCLENIDGVTLAQRLFELSGPALLVDCADMALPVGSGRLFLPEALRTSGRAGVSAHAIGVAEAVGLAGLLGYRGPVWLFGVQPGSVAPGRGLTPLLAERLDALGKALAAAVRNLRREGTVR